MSVEVMETTEGIASWAMSANDGSGAAPVRVRAAGVASRWASERGVMLIELATTMPNTTAAAISAEKESARLVVFSISDVFLLNL